MIRQNCRLSKYLLVLALAFPALAPALAQVPPAQLSWTAMPSTKIVVEPLRFNSHGVSLSGKLYRPDVARKVPVSVVLHDASIPLGDARLYDHLKVMLPALGVAVFTYDRRGTGQSGGSADGNPLELLAEDGIAAGRALQKQPHVDGRRVGFWGLSQGGWLTLLAASRWPHAAFAVSVSAPIVTPDVQMNYLTANKLRIEGYSKADADEAIAARTARDQAARGELDINTARARVQRVANKPWFELIYLNPAVPEQNLAKWAGDIKLDPIKSLGSLKAPTLIIYGSVDPVVPVAISMERLQPLMRKRPNVEAAVISGADHSMMTSRTPKEQMDFSLTDSRFAESPEYLGRLAAWLQRHGFTR